VKIASGEPGSQHVASVTLDGAPVRHCTFADEEAGCVVVLVTDAAGILDVRDDGTGPYIPEATHFGVVKIILHRPGL
jgi:hypothetical protein